MLLAIAGTAIAPHVTVIDMQDHALQVGWGHLTASLVIDGSNSFIADCTLDELISAPETCHTTLRPTTLEGLKQGPIITHSVPLFWGNGVA